MHYLFFFFFFSAQSADVLHAYRSADHRLSLHAAFPFAQIQQEVAELIKDKIVVGHGLKNDFKVSVHLRSCLSVVSLSHDTHDTHLIRFLTIHYSFPVLVG